VDSGGPKKAQVQSYSPGGAQKGTLAEPITLRNDFQTSFSVIHIIKSLLRTLPGIESVATLPCRMFGTLLTCNGQWCGFCVNLSVTVTITCDLLHFCVIFVCNSFSLIFICSVCEQSPYSAGIMHVCLVYLALVCRRRLGTY